MVRICCCLLLGGAPATGRILPFDGRSRQRTGATQWRLFRAAEREGVFVEAFVVRSWDEHLRQHRTRLTGHDLLIEQSVERWVDGEPVSHHLIAVRTP